MLNLLFALLTGDPLASKFGSMLAFRRQAYRQNTIARKAAGQLAQAIDLRDTAKTEYFNTKASLETDVASFPF